MFALIDGNCFYASCERVYQPSIRNKPVIVLSNNDGCVVTRSAEAKAAGIKMGEPYFKIQDIVRQYDVQVFSSNYELYGDMSRRMMKSIATLVPTTEVYSIDECFADVGGMQRLVDLNELGHQIRNRVLQWVGIPTCVGIAPTKTLAKFCNHLAKRHRYFKGVANWSAWDADMQARALNSEPVTEVWGIGRRIGQSLNEVGIETVGDFTRASSAMLRQKFGVVVERTQRELQGVSCLDMETIKPKRQQIIRSRSFGQPVCDLTGLRSAISHHVSEAGRELREEGGVAHTLQVFIQTNRFKLELPQHYGSECVQLTSGTCDTLRINHMAQKALERIYKAGFEYKKCGVILSGIESADQQQQLDWLNPGDSEQRLRLMSCVDGLNARFGRDVLQLGTERMNTDWRMRRDKLSPRVTTRINELLHV
ncbi:Y-family DNA polymerase [Hydromonas duriensis]|uniref:DNA polymerase V n=1 Tax=Hydromonas duriensis TaxID=1527608 RepID=A0A4R6Y1E6_9BURK|nr:Y-family DNA polymerase [Hydromonas duriensis]TDR30241.1 DNA polymerase V [Hydromonas duriensis]